MYRFKQRAFTLVELLVVMALLALSLSIVLPLTVKQVDSARYRGERELAAMFIQRMRHNSFFLSRPMQLSVSGKEMVASSGGFTQKLQLQYVAFDEQDVEFKPLDTATAYEFTASIGESAWTLKIEHQSTNWFNAD